MPSASMRNVNTGSIFHTLKVRITFLYDFFSLPLSIRPTQPSMHNSSKKYHRRFIHNYTKSAWLVAQSFQDSEKYSQVET